LSFFVWYAIKETLELPFKSQGPTRLLSKYFLSSLTVQVAGGHQAPLHSTSGSPQHTDLLVYYSSLLYHQRQPWLLQTTTRYWSRYLAPYSHKPLQQQHYLYTALKKYDCSLKSPFICFSLLLVFKNRFDRSMLLFVLSMACSIANPTGKTF
jgi:hypothetical protein